jgi:hypothetical protein
MPKLTNEIIAAAILGFEAQKKHIDAQITELREMLDGGSKATPAAISEAPTGKRRKFSAAARRRMKEAQQRRWAKIRGEAASPAPAALEPSKPKRRLSKAGKAAIVAALKKRWAAKKAVAQPKPAKKATAKKTSA